MSNSFPVFDTTIQKSMKIIDEVSIEAKIYDKEDAFRAVRATLLALRDRLTVNEAAHVGAQLPILLRGFYYEGWKPAATPRKDRSQEEFLSHIEDYLSDKAPELNSQHVAKSVFTVLSQHISDGEVRDIIDGLPEELYSLWPEEMVEMV